MKAILWKELRENFRWAVLGGLVLTLAEFYVLAGQQQHLDSFGNITLTDATFLLVLSFGCALVAVCLAALQILPERSRDRWAALLHRPVSPGLILGGKAVAGLGLYAAAVVLPFLASACYVAWPGKFPAPFVPGLLLPGIQALAGGVAFYFGSLLLCLQRGRWLGTRGGLLAALGALFVLQMNTTSPFLLVPVVSASVLALAAWHTMLGGDAISRGRWLRRLAFVTVVLVGAQAGLLLAGAGLNLLPKAKNSSAATYSQLRVTPEGQVFRLTSGFNGEGLVVTDLAGQAVTDERYTGNNAYQNFCEFSELGYALDRRRHGVFLAGEDALVGINYVQGVRLGNEARENWYLLVRQNYFVGYDHLSRRCIGICDREGFKAPDAKPVPFEQPLRGASNYVGATAWYWTDHRLYAINFFDRQFKLFFERAASTIDEAAQLSVDRTAESFRYLALALDDGIQVLDADGRSLFARPYLHDPQRGGWVEVAINPAADRLYFISQASFYDPEPGPTVTYLDELDLHGTLVHRYDQFIDNRAPAGPRWITTAQACLLPIVPAVWQHFSHRGTILPWSGTAFSLGSLIAGIDQTGWAAMTLVAGVLAVGAFAWARRAGFTARRAGGWAVFVAAFGPAGLIAFRLVGGWPQRVRCPSCGHLRSLGEDTCPHCHRAWATPPPTGAEIFEPLSAQG